MDKAMKYSYLCFLQQLVFSNTQTALLHETAGYIIAQETSGAPPQWLQKQMRGYFIVAVHLYSLLSLLSRKEKLRTFPWVFSLDRVALLDNHIPVNYFIIASCGYFPKQNIFLKLCGRLKKMCFLFSHQLLSLFLQEVMTLIKGTKTFPK